MIKNKSSFPRLKDLDRCGVFRQVCSGRQRRAEAEGSEELGSSQWERMRLTQVCGSLAREILLTLMFPQVREAVPTEKILCSENDWLRGGGTKRKTWVGRQERVVGKKEPGPQSWTAWAQPLVLSLHSWVTFGKLSTLCACFPTSKMDIIVPS